MGAGGGGRREDGGGVGEEGAGGQAAGVPRAEDGALARPLVADLEGEEVVHAAEGALGGLGVVGGLADLAEGVEPAARPAGG